MLVSRTWNNTLSTFHIFNIGVYSTYCFQQRRIFRVNKIYNHFLISDVLFCVRFFHHQTINAEVSRQGQSKRGRKPTKFFFTETLHVRIGCPLPFYAICHSIGNTMLCASFISAFRLHWELEHWKRPIDLLFWIVEIRKINSIKSHAINQLYVYDDVRNFLLKKP